MARIPRFGIHQIKNGRWAARLALPDSPFGRDLGVFQSHSEAQRAYDTAIRETHNNKDIRTNG